MQSTNIGWQARAATPTACRRIYSIKLLKEKIMIFNQKMPKFRPEEKNCYNISKMFFMKAKILIY